jgi:hypothetical protein
VPYALPAVCLDISSAEAQLGQDRATDCSWKTRVIVHDPVTVTLSKGVTIPFVKKLSSKHTIT